MNDKMITQFEKKTGKNGKESGFFMGVNIMNGKDNGLPAKLESDAYKQINGE